jgi:hypothetical protein
MVAVSPAPMLWQLTMAWKPANGLTPCRRGHGIIPAHGTPKFPLARFRLPRGVAFAASGQLDHLLAVMHLVRLAGDADGRWLRWQRAADARSFGVTCSALSCSGFPGSMALPKEITVKGAPEGASLTRWRKRHP